MLRLTRWAGYDDGCSKSSATCDWMAKIPDSTKLVHMNLPGTHDASTCEYWLCLLQITLYSSTNRDGVSRELLRRDTGRSHSLHWTVRQLSPLPLPGLMFHYYSVCRIPDAEYFRCQEHSIFQMLNGGIRVFDLRYAWNPGNDTVGFYHCQYPYTTLSSVLSSTFSFLSSSLPALIRSLSQPQPSSAPPPASRTSSSGSTAGSTSTPPKPFSSPSITRAGRERRTRRLCSSIFTICSRLNWQRRIGFRLMGRYVFLLAS